jgi:hypothetical protein
MGRRLFGARKRGNEPETPDWPQLPGGFGPPQGLTFPVPLPPPPLPLPAISAAAPAVQGSAEEELLERIAAFRSAVSDTLYDISKDYQVLCNLMHADLTSCDDIIAELRRRLAGNVHYEVLAKLDEAHALVAAHVAAAAAVPTPEPEGDAIS